MNENNETPHIQASQLVETADGSHTLFLPHMDEHYHSTNGAIQEARHVYLQAGLLHTPRSEARLLEIGFGTGLNALLTWMEAEEKQIDITYYTVERYPLADEIIPLLNYASLIEPEQTARFAQLHAVAWDEPVRLSPYFTLHKIEGDSNHLSLPKGLDVIYFDAFGPDKQPEMWNQTIFDKLYKCSNEGCVLTTYCAKGAVRRMMKQAGYTMERIPGPPGKREMLRATKTKSPE